ncbi:biopolymer transporter ExbD [Aquimarina sp. 2201CG5-10]|uniref:ExbD/TolR family protein n=1 Tax=Aquimarina callyspongiae TaxID=3098150 RepID=UPI002AB39457|nr:biopolymer transporter ExbD [Aquimarina sp. 2201CG5-10]MDY8136781.1 biopolymer transporter ExbD [Aquimarina sp. 2201CG5-10]
MTRREAPSVNAGSMADIAFLLLIFFLVSTTIETDQGISRKLPPPPKKDVIIPKIKEKNLFRVEVNQLNDLLVEGSPIKLEELKEAAKAFLDNGGGTNEDACDYCQGLRDSKSSDNPIKAVISLKNSRETDYATYIAVQNELVKAYTELRNRESIKRYGISYSEMIENLKDAKDTQDQSRLRERIKNVQSMYPEKLSEAETKSSQSLNTL